MTEPGAAKFMLRGPNRISKLNEKAMSKQNEEFNNHISDQIAREIAKSLGCTEIGSCYQGNTRCTVAHIHGSHGRRLSMP